MNLIKWIGGKKAMAAQIADLFVSTGKPCVGRYFEPFFGSGAVFFEMADRDLLRHGGNPDRPAWGAVSDINSRLMCMWLDVMSQPSAVAEHLEQMHPFAWATMSHEAREFYFNGVRDDFRKGQCGGLVAAAATFIWLNRMCFNGLYRENGKGEFNAAVGDGKGKLPTREDIMRASRLLHYAHIMHRSAFGVLDSEARGGDWAYLDPPYLETFDRYDKSGFGLAEHEKLASEAERARRRGVVVVVSNTDNERVRELYPNFRVAWSGSQANRVAPGAQTRRQELLLLGIP